MSLASRTAGYEERLSQLAEKYRTEFRTRFNTVVDPFSLGRIEMHEPAQGYSGTRGEKALGEELRGLKVT